MAQGDYCDYSKYVVRVKDLTSDVDELVQFVNDVPETGGGDSPEVTQPILFIQQAWYYICILNMELRFKLKTLLKNLIHAVKPA